MAQIDLEELPRYTVDALGIETNYYEVGRGNGRSVLLLHGMTSSGDAYRELMVALADDYRLIAPDTPGFGFTESTIPFTMDHLVEWVAAFIDALELSPCYLVGHSFGGVLATHFTLAYPEDVERLVLIAPALLSGQKIPDVIVKAGISLGLIDLGTTISQSRVVVPYQVKSGFFQPEQQPDSVWPRRIRDYENARASAHVVKAIGLESPVDFSQMVHPVCLIWGDDDPVVPVGDGEALLDLLPSAELHRLAECGHVPVQEKTAVVVNKVQGFFR